MPRKTLQGVKSGFDNLPDGKWFPVTISGASTRFGKPGSKTANVLQLSLVYTTNEEIHGAKAGRKLFDGGSLEGENAGMTRLRLEEIRPDKDWGEFEFPEPNESQAALEEELVGQDGYVLTKHTPKDRNDANAGVYVNIAKYRQDEPPELMGDEDEYDEEEDEEDGDEDE